MKLKLLFLLVGIFTLQSYALKEDKMNYPIAKKIPYTFEIHNIKIQDEYSWLRSKGWPDNVKEEDILSHLKAENEYFAGFMTPLEKEKTIFFEELKGRIKLEDQSTYVKKDEYYYYSRTESDKDYSIYCRKKGSTEAQEEVLLDVNKLAESKKFLSIGAFSISPDHKLMAYSADTTGGEKFTIKVFDLENKKYLPDEIENTIGGIVWHENLPGFFYTPTNENWRHDKVMYHKLGDQSEKDKLVFHEKDNLYFVAAGKSSSKEYIFISVKGHDNSECYVIHMDDMNFTPKLIKKRKDKVLYEIDHNGKFFYMHTNEAAENFQILRSSIDDFQDESSWKTFIAEEKDKYLSSFDLTSIYLLLNYKVKALPMSMIMDLSNNASKTIKFPDSAFTAGVFSTNFDEDDIRVNYSSLARPNTVFQYDFTKDALTVLKAQEIPSGFNPDEYNVERIFVTNDGGEIPITLFYKKSLFKKDGSNPLYLYGYGSYGISIPPTFKNSAVSLANRGFVYAISHIRGGDDLGHSWYEAAKFLNKKRTFNDFIASAEYLIDEKYTSKGNIVVVGGSAGGMLIGNVINERPELYKAAIAHVPFVDVLNTMLDDTLPLTPHEFKEWGNPKEKEYFDYMKSYSPYDNVKAQNYPNLFVTAGLSDPRVGYWEAAKWVAKLRETKTDKNLIIYKTNMEFGHGGASGRFDYLKEAAEDLVFIMKMFDIEIKN